MQCLSDDVFCGTVFDERIVTTNTTTVMIDYKEPYYYLNYFHIIQAIIDKYFYTKRGNFSDFLLLILFFE